jgi:hypothetical protein
VNYFMLLDQHPTGGSTTSQDNLTQDSCYPSQDSNQAPPKCESDALLLLEPTCLFRLMTMETVQLNSVQNLFKMSNCKQYYSVIISEFRANHSVVHMEGLDAHVGSFQMFTLYCCTVSHRITGFLDFVHHPVFYKLENTMFWKMDLFPSSDKGGRHLLCWVP